MRRCAATAGIGVKTFVINLERDVARREHMVAQMAALAMPFEWIRAIHGASLPAAVRAEHYDEARAKWRRGRALTPSEIGCALSHIKAYRTMVVRGIELALILEDDVDIPAAAVPLISELARVLPSDEPLVCLLSEAEVVPGGALTPLLDGQYSLGRFRSGYYASSYIVTKAAAEVLANALYPVSDVADRWEWLQRRGIVDILAVQPPAITQDQARFGTSTAPEIDNLLRDRRTTLPLYKLRRARNLIWDELEIMLRRMLPRSRRRRSGEHGADRLIDWPIGTEQEQTMAPTSRQTRKS